MSNANNHPSAPASTPLSSAGSASFSWHRFTLLARAHWAEHTRQYLGHLLVTGILYCVLLVFSLSVSRGEVFVTGGQSAFYFWGLYLTGFVFAGRYFDSMARRESALLVLMRPASVLEKWLLCVGIVVVGYPVAYTLLFLAISWPAQGVALAMRAAWADPANLDPQNYALFVPLLRQPLREALLSIPQQWGLFIAAWALQGAAVTGSLYFRKVAMLKTLVLGVVLFIATVMVSVLSRPRDEVLFAWWRDGAATLGAETHALNAALWLALPMLLWWQTYQHLREKGAHVMARFRSRAGAPRKLGPWLFAGVFVMFWVLLAISGMDRFKSKDGDSREYTIPAAQLIGVTRLRIDGDSDDAQGYVPPTRVVLSNTSDITLSLHLRREGRRKGARAQERPGWHAEPPLTVVREGDTLVLRWKPRELPQNAETSDVQDQWIGKIKLPKHFQGLALSHALVEALEPVERLQVSGRSVEVRGEVAHLDLQSTQCGRCAAGGPASADKNDAACDERATKGKNPLLEVSAKNMQSVRIEAWEGNVKVGDTERLKQLDLQLGDHVALLVDRVAVLRLPRGVDGNAGQARGVLPAGDCVVAPALQGDPARSHPLDLLRMPDSPLVAK